MQRAVLFLSIALLAVGCNPLDRGGNSGPILDSTKVQVLDSAYDFGKATEGDKVEFSFRFKNVGNKPLIITNATATCGCTKPDWPQQPIPPGGMGTIRAVFNSTGRVGPAHKLITVYSNASPAFPKLRLSGMVVMKSPPTN